MPGIYNYFSNKPTIEDLLNAISSGNIDSVSAAITPKNINSYSKKSHYHGSNPLAYAIAMYFSVNDDASSESEAAARLEICRLLLEKGAKPNSVLDGNGQTPGHNRVIFVRQGFGIEFFLDICDFGTFLSRIPQAPELSRTIKIARLLVSYGANVPGMLSGKSFCEQFNFFQNNRNAFDDSELAEILLPVFRAAYEPSWQEQGWDSRLSSIPQAVLFDIVSKYLGNIVNIEALCDVSPARAKSIRNLIMERIIAENTQNAGRVISPDLKEVKDTLFLAITKPLKQHKCLHKAYYADGSAVALKKLFIGVFDSIITNPKQLEALKKPSRIQLAAWVKEIAKANANNKNLDLAELTLIYKVLLSAVTKNTEIAESTLRTLSDLQAEKSKYPYINILQQIVDGTLKSHKPKLKG